MRSLAHFPLAVLLCLFAAACFLETSGTRWPASTRSAASQSQPDTKRAPTPGVQSHPKAPATTPPSAESIAEKESKPLNVVFIAAEDEYRSEVSLAGLQTRVTEWGWKSTLLTSAPNQSAADNIPGLEALDTADLVVMYMRFRTIPLEQVEHIDRYLKRGGPLVGIRTSTHAFAYPKGHSLVAWNDFGKDVLGAPWIRHFGHDSTTDVTIAPGMEQDELLKGVEPAFHVRSWLYDLEDKFPPEGSHILLMGQSCDEAGTPVMSRRTSAVAWTRQSPWGGRVFTTTLGHPEDFENPSVQALLNNAMRWAMGVKQVEKGSTEPKP